MTKAARLVAFCLILAVAVPFAYAQNYPMPGASIHPPVICTTCPNYPNMPTWSYSAPLTRFAGRYIDSQLTRDYQAAFGMRTLRAGRVEVVPQHNRIYMIIGSTFASYDMNTFFTNKLGQPLSPNSYIGGTWREGNPAEQHLRWDGHVYPEGPRSGWQTAIVDIQHFLYSFDTDDRNLAYLAYSAFGWGIVRNGSNASLDLVSQTFSNNGLSPNQILSVKSGSSYYALISAGTDTTMMYDVTNPAAPSLVRTLNFGVTSWETVPGHVGLITGGKVRIYTNSSLIAGGGPLAEYTATTGKFQMIDSDDTQNFYAVENHSNSPLRFSVFTPATGTYAETKHSNGERFLALGMRWGSGFLTVWGYDQTFKSDVRVFKLSNNQPAEIGLNAFFKNYYTAPPAGYARPAGYTDGIQDVVIHNYNGRDYLFYANHGMGDVYELNGPGTPLPPTPTPTPGPTPTPTPTPNPTPTPPGGGGPTPTPNPVTCPVPTALQINAGCLAGNCVPNSPITFAPADFYLLGRFSGNCSDTFSWSFGDGHSSTERMPQHTYTTAGHYTVHLTVTTDGVNKSAQKVVTVGSPGGPTPTPTPTPGGPTPTPSPTPTPTPPPNACSVAPTDRQITLVWTGALSNCSRAGTCLQGETVNFTLERFDPSFQFASCHNIAWTFPGNVTKNGLNVQHSFTQGGPQPVSVTVSVNGSSTTLNATVQVEGQPAAPVTSVSISQPTGSRAELGVPTTFVASAAPDDENVTFTWTFGDGTGDSGKSVTKTFNTPGEYEVAVTAARGTSSAQASRNFTVSPANTFAFLLPVVAHLPGNNGTSWRTDLQILNTDPEFSPSDPMVLEVTFKGQTKELVVDSSTMIREDFMNFFTDGDEAGPMIVRGTAEHVPQMWTRTYVASPSGVGTYGQFIPAVPLDTVSSSAVGDGPRYYYLAGLESNTGPGSFRTNLGLVNPTNSQLQARFIAFPENSGVPIGQFTVTVEPFQLLQINDMRQRIPALQTFNKKYSIEVENLTGGDLVVYQSSIDQISNDPAYVQGLSTLDTTAEGNKTQWVPGVARLENGNWKSDLTVFNPDRLGVQFNLTFFDQSGNEIGTGSHTLEAKHFLHFNDILRTSAMDLPADGNLVGAIRIDTVSVGVSNYPMIHGRTYSDRTALGTFGQGIAAFAGDTPNIKSSQTGFIAGIRNNPSYRTNLGLIATQGPVTVEVTLLNKITGAPIGLRQYELAANQSIIQTDIISALHPSADAGSLRIRVVDGESVWAYASMIDRLTNDPEYVPATPIDNE